MNKENILSFYEDFPVFDPKKVLAGQAKMTLDGITQVLEILGNPQDDLSILHVAGTNGKGSTIAFLHQILEENGYKTGVFTSPAVDHFTEQIQIDHKDIALEDLATMTTKVIEAEKICGQSLTSFEMLVCVAFVYFQEKACDFVLLEVGMGGIDDATNVISNSLCSIITSISYDHMNLLGNTLSSIAQKKAGIIKENGCVITTQQEKDVIDVLQSQTEKKHADIFVSKQAYSIQREKTKQVFTYKEKTYTISLLGTYQVENACLALEVIDVLKEKGVAFSYEKVKEALLETRWSNRFELIHKEPEIILDGSHNIEGIQTLRDSLEAYYPKQKVTFVMGVLADKDYDEMIETLLPLAKEVYCVQPDNPRALSAQELAERIETKGIKTHTEDLETSLRLAVQDSLVCVCGSLYLLGQVRKQMKEIVF